MGVKAVRKAGQEKAMMKLKPQHVAVAKDIPDDEHQFLISLRGAIINLPISRM